MRNIFLLFFTFFIATNTTLTQTAAELRMDSLRVEYIRNYKDIAMDEMDRSGIPASIKLAQGILESRAGTSELAMRASNHFGIKCGKGWAGASYSKHDDEHDKRGRAVQSCFRKYNSVVECFADHSAFIRNPDKEYRYGFLFQLDPLDYKAWAEGLQKAGYSSVDFYAERLIYYIELHQLYQYDQQAYRGRVAPKRLAEVNGAKMVQARDGETLADIARMYNLPLDTLLRCNDNLYAPDQALSLGAWVYMQNKGNSWSGPEIFHKVEAGQTLFDIAQRYGIRLESLQKRNGLRPGEQPANYEYIRLRGASGLGEQIIVRRSDDEPAGQQVKISPNQSAKNGPGKATRIVVEMLPETILEAPVAAYSISETQEAPAEAVFPASPDAAEPLILIDTQTGETQIFHTVRQGETLYSIAQRFQVSTGSIRQLNKIKGNVVRTGQSLRVQ